MKQKKPFKSFFIPDTKYGFTLIELSIVLVIVGLLIGGILVGQSLISASRSQGVIRENEQYLAAVRLFHDRFRGFPGDSSKAGQMFGTALGDNNGIIDNTTEAFWAWRQLSMSGLIPKKAETADGHYTGTASSAQVVIGINAPRSTVFKNASWTLYSSASNFGYSGSEHDGFNQLRIARREAGQNGSINPRPFIGPFTSTEALALDGKLDDAKPGSGDLGHYAPHAQMFPCSTSSNPTTAKYNLTIKGDVCHMAFWMSKF